jgi:hypothetical protein
MKRELTIAELTGNERPLLTQEVFHNSQCSVGDNLSHDSCLFSRPRPSGLSEMRANESDLLGYSLKVPAQPAWTGASKDGSRGDRCKECSGLTVLDQVYL